MGAVAPEERVVGSGRLSFHTLPAFMVLIALVALLRGIGTAALPAGFTEKEVAKGLSSPSGMAIAADGRVFIAEQEGRVLVLKRDSLLVRPVLTLKVESHDERGLTGIALDPDFPASPYLYVYYTAPSPSSHNRLSRFAISGDEADAAQEQVLFDLPDIGAAIWHMGGGLAFGKEGKLYCGVGDHQKPAEARNPDSPFGKVLRINRDGSIPSDNPRYASAMGIARAVWASGLRNPFSLAAGPGGVPLLANDVGESSFEEIDDVTAGGDFGWPSNEGPGPDAAYAGPLLAYGHNDGCAVMGGDFYRPDRPLYLFPPEYDGKYFFADFCDGWIRTADPAAAGGPGSAAAIPAAFSDKAAFPTKLRIAPDGSLYYLSRGYATGNIKPGVSKLFRIRYGEGGIGIRKDGTDRTPARNGSDPRILITGSGSAGGFRIRIGTPANPDAFPWIRVEIRDRLGRLRATLAENRPWQGNLDLSWMPVIGHREGLAFLVVRSAGRVWSRPLVAPVP
ncbi:MAG: hypothetical protein JWP91_2062 [Fibrobacteres bacterium]|nr:hypothetical protein [Fibrobacterota bacterium]